MVRSDGENQAADIAGGAAMTVTPDKPLSMAHKWLMMVKTRSSFEKHLNDKKRLKFIQFETSQELRFQHL